MSAKKARSQQDAEKMLQKRPVLALFYMEGCPHCASNQPAWEEAKGKVKKESPETEIVEIEADDVPMSAGVHSFPTMVYKSRGGDEKKAEGSQPSGEVLLQNVGWKQNPLKELKPWKTNPTRKGGKRRKSLRRKTRRRV